MNIQIGDIIEFGHYEQNSCAENREMIEWQVLDTDGQSVLVISRFALECMKYNESSERVTWETCTLRSWLNGDFIENAFTPDERSIIEKTSVHADRNPMSSINPGRDTEDMIFLLSTKEVNRYFRSDRDKQCAGTEHCMSGGAFKGRNGNCWWWLRSPGFEGDCAARVYDDGSVDVIGGVVQGRDISVRPAMRIKTSSQMMTVKR